ncbi:macro domain-containing protein [Gossypium australe]|uniref:Macro domain-containing protein n=1 Tax=Gossypium australe TaxID=47621 RepID=A0A5B6UBC2_9ROSI|nr:macro domain-containing protein [Gossypium australe]
MISTSIISRGGRGIRFLPFHRHLIPATTTCSTTTLATLSSHPNPTSFRIATKNPAPLQNIVKSSSPVPGIVGFSMMASATAGEDGHFKLSETSVLKINKGDITKWFIDGSSDAIVSPFSLIFSKIMVAEERVHSSLDVLSLSLAKTELIMTIDKFYQPYIELLAQNLKKHAIRYQKFNLVFVVPPEKQGLPRKFFGFYCQGFKLPASHVIHTVGPIYDSDKDPKGSLRNAYKNCLTVAKENNIKYIAFPSISCGVYGYPYEEAATVALSTIKEFADDIKEVHFVLFADDIYDIWTKKAKELL